MQRTVPPTPKGNTTPELNFLAERNEPAKEPHKLSVANCPYRAMGLDNPCEKVPNQFVCGTPACWALGAELKAVCWDKLSEQELAEFAKLLADYDGEPARCFLSYCKKERANGTL